MGVKLATIVMFFVLTSFTLGYTMGTEPVEFPNNNEQVAPERFSPSNWIDQQQIHLYHDKVVIDIENPQWAIFANTNSMDPFIDENTHAIQIIPQNQEQLHVGDVISFTSTNFDGIIIHRIIEIGSDEQGWYAITKGDNNYREDALRVRFSQIRRVLVGVLY